MAKTYQASNFTGQQLDDFMGRLLTGSFAGTGLSLDGRGVLHSKNPGLGDLLYSYTHTSNTEVHPKALDIATGVFTEAAHGLAQGDEVFISVHTPYNILSPYQYLPGGLILGTVGGRNKVYYVNVLDENHFTLSETNGGAAVTYTQVTTMDLTKFHVERINRIDAYNDFKITGLPQSRDLLLVLKGRIDYRYRYFCPMSGQEIPAKWQPSLGQVDGWNSFQAYLEFHMIEDRHVVQTFRSDAYSFSSADQATVKEVASTSAHHYIMPDNYMDGFYFHNGGGFYNGTTLEVYGR